MSVILSPVDADERAQFVPSDPATGTGQLHPFAGPGANAPIATPDLGLKHRVASLFAAAWLWLAARSAQELARGAGFICLPVFMGTGAIIYYALPFEPSVTALGASVGCLSLLAWLGRGYPLIFVGIAALLAVLVGASAAKIEVWRASTSMVGSDVATRVTGRIVMLEHQASGRTRLTLDLIKTERPALRYSPDRVRLTARKVPEGLRSGDVVEGFARLMQPSGPVRAGGYDFSFNSYFRGIGSYGFFLSEVVTATDEIPPRLLDRPVRLLESIREALADRIRQHVSGPEGEIAVALIVGYRAGIPEEMNEALRRSGLAHILSISGLHMALVAGTVMLMTRSLFAFFSDFSSRYPVKKYAAVAALLFCTLYLALSGADVAAQRSYLMLAIMLVAVLFDRAAISMRNVAIAAIVILLIAPHEVIGPSFQMSFAATAALVAGFAAWTEWRRRRHEDGTIPSRHLVSRFLRLATGSFGGLALTSIIAGTASAIYGVWHFQRATPFSLPSNLAASPPVSMVVMPAAVCAILVMPFGLEGYFLKAMQWGIGVMVDIAIWFSDRTPVDAVGLLPPGAVLGLTLALLVLVISTTSLRLLALPLAAFGFASMMDRTFPDVMVSEDARLVAIRGGDGTLSVNRARPSSFSMDDWKRALLSDLVITPVKPGADPGREVWPGAFSCEAGVCLASFPSGSLVVHAKTAEFATAFCTEAALIVVEDATVEEPCGPNSRVLVLTGRDLARKGAASVHMVPGDRPRVVHAITEPWRPWHYHRAFSRAARGLPPYQRQDG